MASVHDVLDALHNDFHKILAEIEARFSVKLGDAKELTTQLVETAKADVTALGEQAVADVEHDAAVAGTPTV